MRLKFWQYHSREWIDFWRTDTGEHVGKRLLEFGSDFIDDMPDVGFRVTNHGQAEITVDGVSYRMQIYPPSLTNNDPTFGALWRMVEERALPVFWFLDDRALDRVGLFMRRVAELDEWTRLHPDVPCVITHGLGAGGNHPPDRRARGADTRARKAAGARRASDAGQMARLPVR